MSSAATTTPAIAAMEERQTYWCHVCDMSVSLMSPSVQLPDSPENETQAPTPTPTLLCPECHGDFLELMDSSLPPPPPPTSNTTNVNDLILDSPYLHRLIHHLSDPDDPLLRLPTHSLPASKASVEAIPTLTISASMLQPDDPIILCAICKDQLLLHAQAKQLPCNHLYHSDCILPWLSNHNSCPVCRFQLPTEDPASLRTRRRRPRPGFRFRDFMEDEDWLGFGSTLRHIARRHRVVFPATAASSAVLDSSSLSPTQMGEAENEFVAMTSSVETVSSNWPVEMEVGLGGGDGDMGMSARLLNEDADTTSVNSR